jgi:hypothetical protein
MRNAATHSGKDLAREIALLKKQLDDLAYSRWPASVSWQACFIVGTSV